MPEPKKIDLSNLTNEELVNIDALAKRLVTREKDRMEVASHGSDHSSHHGSEPA